MTAKFTVEIEVEVEYDYRPGAPLIMPSFRDEVGDPGYAEEIEITKIVSFAILEPRRDPLPNGSWTKTKWLPIELLTHLQKYVTPAQLTEIIFASQYVVDLAEDAVREEEMK